MEKMIDDEVHAFIFAQTVSGDWSSVSRAERSEMLAELTDAERNIFDHFKKLAAAKLKALAD